MKKTFKIILLITWCFIISHQIVYSAESEYVKIEGSKTNIETFSKSLIRWNPFVEKQNLSDTINEILENINDLIGPTFIRSQITIKVYSRNQLDEIFVKLPKNFFRLSYQNGIRPKSWYASKEKSIYIDTESDLGILIHELTHAVLHQNFILSHKIAEMIATEMEVKIDY